MSDSQWVEPYEVICSQADQIAALKAERDRLRTALEQIASIPDHDELESDVWTDTAIMLATAKQIARRALAEVGNSVEGK